MPPPAEDQPEKKLETTTGSSISMGAVSTLYGGSGSIFSLYSGSSGHMGQSTAGSASGKWIVPRLVILRRHAPLDSAQEGIRYVYIYTHIYMIYIYIYIYNIYIYTYIYVIYIYTNIYIYTYIHIHIHIQYIYFCPCIHVYML
jgi:hypothetical protein